MTFNVRRWDGNPISEPGIYADVPMWAYHGQLTVGPSISSSGLRTIFMDSPRHYFRDSYLNPNRKPKKESDAFIMGRASHHLILGESDFAALFAVRPEVYPEEKDADLYWQPTPDAPGKAWNGNANWCRAWLSVAQAFGLTVLTPNDIENIRGMAEALSEHPMVADGCLNGLIEHSFVWKDEETGIWLKWRPDAMPTDSLLFTDLKTATSVNDEAIEYAVGDYAYEMQGALGDMGCRALLGSEMEAFSLMIVEKTDPWCVRHKTIRPGDLEDGAKSLRAALTLFARCVETGKWPGPGGDQTDAEYTGLNQRSMKQRELRRQQIQMELESL